LTYSELVGGQNLYRWLSQLAHILRISEICRPKLQFVSDPYPPGSTRPCLPQTALGLARWADRQLLHLTEPSWNTL